MEMRVELGYGLFGASNDCYCDKFEARYFHINNGIAEMA